MRIDLSLPHFRRVARWIALAAGVAVWAAWVAYGVIAEWRPTRLGHGEADRQLRDRVTFETAYTAGWLTRYVRTHGALPAEMPDNKAAADNGEVLAACPTSDSDLQRCDVDWIYCAQARTVQAAACHPNRPPPGGGWDFSLWPRDDPRRPFIPVQTRPPPTR